MCLLLGWEDRSHWLAASGCGLPFKRPDSFQQRRWRPITGCSSHLAEQRRASQIALGIQKHPEVADQGQRGWVLISQRRATPRQRLAIQRRRASQIALGL